MKKLSIISLSILLALSLSVTAWAVADSTTLTGTSPSTTIPVTGTCKAASSGETVYSVDISWGSMEFFYQTDIETWNPNTHTYDKTNSGWTFENGANQIIIKNHSNIYLNCSFAYQKTIDSVSCEFSEPTLFIDSAEHTTPSNPPTGIETVTLSGSLENGTHNATVGTITVTIA